MPQVYNRHHGDEPDDAVYVGRPTKWGNPYTHLMHGGGIVVSTRKVAIKKYKEYLLTRPDLKEDAKLELEGKDLVCWCKPGACHADVLLEIANGW